MIVTGALLGVAVATGKAGDAGTLTAILGFSVSMGGFVLNLTRTGGVDAHPEPSERLDRHCGQLAAAVTEQWQREWRLRRLQDPEPLQVHWRLAESWLTDPWEGEDDGRMLQDRLENVADVFDRVPSRRLVVLGAPGSGKTVLAVRFTLDVLLARQTGDPVPVIFSLSGWRPDRQTLHAWMADSIAATYPGADWSRELLAAGLVLPVLDGLDEIPGPLRVQAVEQLNASFDPGAPVLLTCRTEVYTHIAQTGDVFTAAAAVELQSLSFEDASAYLDKTARPVRGLDGRRATRWDPVLAHIRAQPDDGASRTVRQVLQTPLMVAMARQVYGEGTADPRELLDGRYADADALEEHLLGAFVPAAFRDDPQADRAGHWLAFLATHLEHQHTRDLAWWRLRLALPRPLRDIGPFLLLGVIAVVLSLVIAERPTAETLLVTVAFLTGAGLGHLLLTRTPGKKAAAPSRGRVLPPAALGVGAAAVLGTLAGLTGDLGLAHSFSFNSFISSRESTNHLALAVTAGLATSVILTVVGTTRDPVPATAAFARGHRTSPLVRVLTVAALLATVAAALLSLREIFQLGADPKPAFISLGAAAVLAVVTVIVALLTRWLSSPKRARHGPGSAHTSREHRHAARAVGRGAAAGLLAGFCFGIAFGLGDGTVLALRAHISSSYPHGAATHVLADGTRYVITAEGWRLGYLPDGTRYVRTPGPVHGIEAQESYSSNEYAIATSEAGDYCTGTTRCVPFYGPVEIRRPGTVKLPQGTVVDDYGLQDRLPPGISDWLFGDGPGWMFNYAMRFGLQAGLSLGLVSGLLTGVHRLLFASVDVTRYLSPLASLHTDRTTAAARSIMIFFLGLIGVTVSLAVGWGDAPSVAVIIWTVAGPLSLLLSAWGWLLTARLWLCTTGRLPWRLMAFLHQAHHRGVLRQVGALYQFRHARLQEHLATAGTDDCGTHPTRYP
ncbi:NACHT domain-containing protein [Streptomyces sp. NBC_01262]|uniref:NACHT domain-containing protein n=1 Tax=Streptomyces sp. NBC_01262 TaxID=2903803 RepID=UPI002E328C65|nr:NACHT domain-containing protein [Streptomyces sp. NBC_01262]